jgi:hypothetical protein
MWCAPPKAPSFPAPNAEALLRNMTADEKRARRVPARWSPRRHPTSGLTGRWPSRRAWSTTGTMAGDVRA